MFLKEKVESRVELYDEPCSYIKISYEQKPYLRAPTHSFIHKNLQTVPQINDFKLYLLFIILMAAAVFHCCVELPQEAVRAGNRTAVPSTYTPIRHTMPL